MHVAQAKGGQTSERRLDVSNRQSHASHLKCNAQAQNYFFFFAFFFFAFFAMSELLC